MTDEHKWMRNTIEQMLLNFAQFSFADGPHIDTVALFLSRASTQTNTSPNLSALMEWTRILCPVYAIQCA